MGEAPTELTNGTFAFLTVRSTARAGRESCRPGVVPTRMHRSAVRAPLRGVRNAGVSPVSRVCILRTSSELREPPTRPAQAVGEAPTELTNGTFAFLTVWSTARVQAGNRADRASCRPGCTAHWYAPLRGVSG